MERGPATAAIATFYETLVMMAAGGLVAGLGFALAGQSPPVEITLPGLGETGIADLSPGRTTRVRAGAGVSGGGAARRPFAGSRSFSACPFPEWVLKPCPRFTGGLLVPRAALVDRGLGSARLQSARGGPGFHAAGARFIRFAPASGDGQRGPGHGGGVRGRGLARRAGGAGGGADGRAGTLAGSG